MGERPSPYPQVPLGTARPTAPVIFTVVIAQKTKQMEDKRHELWRCHGVRAGGTWVRLRTTNGQSCSKTSQSKPSVGNPTTKETTPTEVPPWSEVSLLQELPTERDLPAGRI